MSLIPPTRVRYAIVLIAMLAAVLLYLERVCLSVAEVYIREDIGIDKDQMSYVLGAFFFAYAIGQVPAGWASQRFGPRLMLSLYMLGWSIFGVFIAFAHDFWTLFLARFLLGLSQAGAYPTAAILVKRWIPDRHRGFANSVVAFGGRFGGAGANWMTGILIVAFVPMSVDVKVSKEQLLNSKLIHEPSSEIRKDEERSPDLLAIRHLIRGVEQNFVTVEGKRVLMENPGKVQEPTPEVTIDRINSAIRIRNLSENIRPESVSLTADGRAIFRKPVEQRSEAETERLNRLLVEKAFPGAIRQLHSDGWRPTLLVYGIGGLVVGLLFWVIARDTPGTHPWANEAEKELIVRGQVAAAQNAGSNHIPFGELLASRNQWYFSANQVFSNIGWIFLITLMPRYLDERFGVPVETRGLMTTIPLFLAAFAMIGGGWASDHWSSKIGRRWGRSLPMGGVKVFSVVAMAAVPFAPDPWTAVVLLSLMSVAQDFGIPAVWAFAQDTGGKQVGPVIGWANMWGNFGAGFAPIALRLIEKHAGGWDAVFVTGALAFFCSGVAGMLANAGKPLFVEIAKSEENPA